MREFSCRSIGNDCGWKHAARTEELLMDTVAVHLREVHGVQALTQDMIGGIKRAFSTPDEPVEARGKDSDPVLKEFKCKDLGMDCGFRFIAQTEELIADGVAVHAREAHGILEFTPEMAAQVKSLAHEWGLKE
jgi:predicted small metal-binding protein